MTKETLDYVELKHIQLTRAKSHLQGIDATDPNDAEWFAYWESKIKLINRSLACVLDRPFTF